MKTPKKEVEITKQEEIVNSEKTDKMENELTENELESVAGGVAPIIKPPTP
jgi:bacteriocin-like protein